MSDKLALKDYLTLKGTLRCVTGLRIGTSTDVIEIGGMDNPIIKHPLDGLPYVPGSSLKGKMRSLLELRHDKIDAQPYELDKNGQVKKGKNNKPFKNRNYGDVHKPDGHGCDKDKCLICRLFGSSAGEGSLGPGRLIVRDAYLTKGEDGWQKKIEKRLAKGDPVTEIKHENTINRITAMANPRTMERVPAGVEFTFEIGYRIFDTGDDGTIDWSLFKHVAEGLQLVVVDTLGGSGSRGYGKVAFDQLTLTNLAGELLLENGSLEDLLKLEL
ncbi:MAG: type III-A CRISPR-associated RAMP protein Csm3 [Chloroflexi bacterium]|nr:type III-A CRISPR-associated RAMP protein Csm3 [Chloroflexota bacterium]